MTQITLEEIFQSACILKVEEDLSKKYYQVNCWGRTDEVDELFLQRVTKDSKDCMKSHFDTVIPFEYSDMLTAQRYVDSVLGINHLLMCVYGGVMKVSQQENLQSEFNTKRSEMIKKGLFDLLRENPAFSHSMYNNLFTESHSDLVRSLQVAYEKEIKQTEK